jgi:hypothetical protein
MIASCSQFSMDRHKGVFIGDATVDDGRRNLDAAVRTARAACATTNELSGASLAALRMATWVETRCARRIHTDDANARRLSVGRWLSHAWAHTLLVTDALNPFESRGEGHAPLLPTLSVKALDDAH